MHHFDQMGKIVVSLLALIYLYFNLNEFLVPAFKMEKSEEAHLMSLFTGEFSMIFWFAISTSMIIPIMILITRKRQETGARVYSRYPWWLIGFMV